tara:strand:- start:1234 stop:1647 length:414 start_codon:yes stop_codon:yes gene_type:complete
MSNALKFINSKIRVLSNAIDDPRGQHSRDMSTGNYNIVEESRTLLRPTHTASEIQTLVDIRKAASEKRRSSNRRRSIDEPSFRSATNERSSVNPHPVLKTVHSSIAAGPSDESYDDLYGNYSEDYPSFHNIMYSGYL